MLTVRPVDRRDHLAFVTAASGSFLQTPAWGDLKTDWRAESLGWFDGPTLVGAGLALYRRTPVVERYLAYLPEGPVLDWSRYDAGEVTAPLLAHLRRRKAFTAKIGPQLVTRRWSAATVKAAVAQGRDRLREVTPDTTDPAAVAVGERLRALGWRRREAEGAGFGDLQPRYVFQVPLRGRTTDELFAGMNQLWRRNVRKAEKAGLTVERAGAEALPAFHDLYLVTARRDGFTPRPLAYFQRMFTVMAAEDADRIRLYLARDADGEALAATTWVRVGERVWYSYGASSDHKRELRPSNAVQWRMLSDAHAAGAAVYDLRGISDTLREDDPLFGLIRFKVGTGGEAVEYLGEWDYPVRPLTHRAFEAYLARR